MIDVDNFKTVNDMFGHLYGDIVLTQLADYLKQLFRADDVIGRVGGDEFFVFLKNFKALDHLKEKAAEICALFQKTYAEKDYTVEISASIGIAICEQNNMEFEQLYQNADTALYSAKAAGKNRYAFFDGNAGSTYNSVRTEIDTHGNIQKSFRENRVEFIFKLLYDSKTTVSSVHSVLQLITEHFGFSRGYIFENSEDGQYTSNTFEWCKNGIRPEIKNLQNVPIEAVSTAMSSFEKSGMFALYSIYDLSPVEWKVLEPQGIKSMFQFGIKDEGRYVGFIGFDDCEKQRTPTDSEIDEICTICNLLSMFLVKQRSLEKAQNNYKMMRSIIDSFDSYSYVVDVDTFEVLYENDNIQKHFKESAVGQICYEAYKNLDAPCPECLIADLKESAEGRVTKVTCDPLHNLCTKYTSCLVDWKNGRKACLNSRIDINCGVAD